MTRLHLADGHWVDVKDKLKVYDREEVHSYSVDGMATDGRTYRFNIVKHQTATAAVRILNWSLTSEDGKPIAWVALAPFADRIAIIRHLDDGQFEEVNRAIQKHLEATRTPPPAAATADGGQEKNAQPDGVSA